MGSRGTPPGHFPEQGFEWCSLHTTVSSAGERCRDHRSRLLQTYRRCAKRQKRRRPASARKPRECDSAAVCHSPCDSGGSVAPLSDSTLGPPQQAEETQRPNPAELHVGSPRSSGTLTLTPGLQNTEANHRSSAAIRGQARLATVMISGLVSVNSCWSQSSSCSSIARPAPERKEDSASTPRNLRVLRLD